MAIKLNPNKEVVDIIEEKIITYFPVCNLLSNSIILIKGGILNERKCKIF